MSFDKSKMTLIFARATVREVEVTKDLARAAVNEAIERANKGQHAETAALDPVGDNQKPRMLQLSSWICHAGKPNVNRQAFLDTDLAEAVGDGLFVAPYFGMIDFNHDFNSYGAWFKARYAYDPKAGQWGILAEGAIFAWRYTELADKMLAMQARQGFIDVSMACMPGDYEEHKDDAGPYLLIRKPVFFTTSVLDVEPADPNARALGSESTSQTDEDRAAELMRASNNAEEMMDNKETVLPVVEVVAEPVVAAEVVAVVPEVVVVAEVAAETVVAEVVAEVVPAVVAEVVAVAEVIEPDMQAQLAAALVEMEAQTTARQTAEVALVAANTALAALTTEVTDLRAFKLASETATRGAAVAKVREARMLEIPAHIAAALDDEEGVALVGKWMEQSEETWTTTKKVFAVASPTRKTAAERSAAEGMLSTATDEKQGEFAISKFRKNG